MRLVDYFNVVVATLRSHMRFGSDMEERLVFSLPEADDYAQIYRSEHKFSYNKTVDDAMWESFMVKFRLMGLNCIHLPENIYDGTMFVPEVMNLRNIRLPRAIFLYPEEIALFASDSGFTIDETVKLALTVLYHERRHSTQSPEFLAQDRVASASTDVLEKNMNVPSEVDAQSWGENYFRLMHKEA